MRVFRSVLRDSMPRHFLNPALRHVKAGAFAISATLLFCGAALAQSASTPDAVIERWHQSWTLNQDGTSVFEEIIHVRLNSDRVYNEFADPRITYDNDTDNVELLAAFVRLPDGRVVETPDYGRNIVSPPYCAGWPAFASWRQLVVSMSGIELGCVTQLEYRVTRKAGAPVFSGEVALDHRYPVKERSVHVNLPIGMKLRHSGEFAANVDQSGGPEGSMMRYRWSVSQLDGIGNEPQTPPSVARRNMLYFTTAAENGEVLSERHGRIESATSKDALVRSVAEEAVKEAVGDSDRMRALCKFIARRFTLVEFDGLNPPRALRPADAVLASHYGSRPEAAALLLSLARAVGIKAAATVVCRRNPADAEVLTENDITADVVTFGSGDAVQLWAPFSGRVTAGRQWDDGFALSDNLADLTKAWPIAHWTSADQCALNVDGRLKLAADGACSGRMQIALSGVFADTESLRDEASRKATVASIVKHVIDGATVDDISVTRLDDTGLECSVAVTLEPQTIPVSGDGAKLCCVSLGRDPAFMTCVSMPAAERHRAHPVRITAPFTQRIALTIETADGVNVTRLPGGVSQQSGAWGSLTQSVVRDGNTIEVKQLVRFDTRDIAPQDFDTVARATAMLRSQAARFLLIEVK